MNPSHRHQMAAIVLLAAGLGATSGALARNEKLLLSIDAALRSSGTQQMLSPDISLRFGRASAEGADASTSTTSVHAVARATHMDASGSRPQAAKSDEAVCLDAFRQAVAELQSRARKAGATAVVGIVSNYGGVEADSPAVYECRVGISRSVVDLKGQFVRGTPATRTMVVAPPITTAPDPAPDAIALPSQAQPARIATGFAAIDDIDAIPYLNDRGRQGYREWLTKSTPRAFAIAPSGSWHSTWGLKPKNANLPADPSERALLLCERAAGMPCKLYAVNGAVVWVKDTK